MENKKKISKINEFNILGINIQIILTVIVLIFGLLYLIVGSKFRNIFYIFIGLDLIVMGYNNIKIFKKQGATIVYFATGIALIIYTILSMIGVL
jgi:hypothetical protein